MIPDFETREQLAEWLDNSAQMRRRFDELLPSIITNDGLVPTAELVADDPRRWRLRKDQSVDAVPHWRIESIADFLQQVPRLWKQAALRIQSRRAIVGRAPVYGVPFDRAIGETHMLRPMKSQYWVEVPRAANGAIFARLFVRVMRRKESNDDSLLVVEAWQWIGEGVEVDYAHMILDPKKQIATHVDGAEIRFSAESDVVRVFDTSTKQKGIDYQKFFRLDGEVAMQDAVGIIGRFFPVEELTDEYFRVSSMWPSELT